MMVLSRRQKPLPAATPSRAVESGRYDTEKRYIEHQIVLLWTCENCGDSGMTTLVEVCPQCEHYRCTNCDLYSGKGVKYCQPFPPVDYQCHILKSDSVSSRILIQSSSEAALSSSCEAFVRRSPKDRPESLLIPTRPEKSHTDKQWVESAPLDERFAPLPSVETPDLVMASDTLSSCGYSTPSSEGITTPNSTQDSNTSNGLFSRQDYIDSEFGTDDTSSSEDMTDDDSMETKGYVIDTLDSRLLSILDYNLKLASRLIPQIHAQLQVGAYTASPSQESRETTETHKCFASSTSTPGTRSSGRGPLRNKRRRERDDSKDRGDKADSKRPRRFRDRSAIPRRPFACHFHKKDAARYCPLTDRKFNMCLGRGNPELRRMKEHYLKAHRPSQCERCYTIFKDRDELGVHQRAESPCHKGLDVLKEGINDGQWEKIEPLFQVRRKLSQSQKEQDDISNWFKIWDILFPNDSRPPHPWVDLLVISSNALPNDTEGILNSFNAIIELDIERGLLPRNDEAHQRYERAFRLALQSHGAISTLATSFNESFQEIGAPERDSTERSSERANTIELLGNSFRQLVTSQPTPQALLSFSRDDDSPRLDSQLASSVPEQFHILDGAYLSQPLDEGVSLMSNGPSSSNTFEALMEWEDTSISEQHLTMSSFEHGQPQAMEPVPRRIEHPAASDVQESQEFLGLWAPSSSFDPWRNSLVPLDTPSFGFDEEQSNADTLPEILDSEMTLQPYWPSGRAAMREARGFQKTQ